MLRLKSLTHWPLIIAIYLSSFVVLCLIGYAGYLTVHRFPSNRSSITPPPSLQPTPLATPYPEITQENYPEINFVNKPFIINPANTLPKDWETIVQEDRYQIQHPSNRMATHHENGVEFCPPSGECQDTYPYISITDNLTLEKAAYDFFNCNIDYCNNHFVMVRPLKFGQYTGWVFWEDKLTQREVLDRKYSRKNIVPNFDSPPLFMIVSGGSLYKFGFDPTNSTELLMLSSFKFPEQFN